MVPRSTCVTAALHPVQFPMYLEQDINLSFELQKDLPHLQNLLALCNYKISYEKSCFVSTFHKSKSISNVTKQRFLIVLLLLLSGNVQPNPGPELQCSQTPSEFKSSPGLKIVHLNVRSLLPKMDMIKIWVQSTDADIVLISETWLSKYISDEHVSMAGYNIYRTDRLKKGGGVAAYVKSKFDATIVLSESICKQLEFLALNVNIAKGLCITVACCY